MQEEIEGNKEDFIDFNIQIDTDSDLYKVVQQFSLEQSAKIHKRRDTIKRQADTMVKIVINLLRGYGAYRITLQKKLTDKSTRYCHNIYKHKYRKLALEHLKSIGFCEYVLGSRKDKRETNVYSSSKLLSYFSQYGLVTYNNKIEETIIIKDVDFSTSFIGAKFKVPYEDDDYGTKALRDSLDGIRKAIESLSISYPNHIKRSDNNHKLSCSFEYYPLIPLLVGPLYKDDKFYSLYRVFNDGSLNSGGRIFGGPWINMKKEQRKGMRINDAQCVVVDYNSMAVMQLDALDGRTIYNDYDNYAVPGLEKVNRKAIKKQVQRMINSETMPKSFRSKDKTIAEGFKGIDFESAHNAIMKHLGRISHYFGTGIGKKLMNDESTILILVLQELIDLGIPALPLHDAVITTSKNAKRVQEVMQDVFDRFYGTIGASADIKRI